MHRLITTIINIMVTTGLHITSTNKHHIIDTIELFIHVPANSLAIHTIVSHDAFPGFSIQHAVTGFKQSLMIKTVHSKN